MIKKFFFWCRVIKLLKRQDKELRKLYKSTIDKKLRLGSNFPIAALYSIKNAVVIGLIKPKKAIATLYCKLCIGNARVKIKIRKIIRHQEEAVTIDHGRVWKVKELKIDKPTTWKEEANVLLIEGNLEIRNQEKKK